MTGRASCASRSVTYRYPHAEQPALRDVSVDIAPGEFVVAAGLSASGKSTFLRAASGLVPHFHGGEFGGRVLTGGLDTREHGPAALSAVAGTLFQDPETQVVLSTVRAELALPLENRGHGAAAVARGVEEAALALGIGDLLDRSTHELSGGELQRVALGAALAGRPRILLLDEPTSQLDPVAGDELVWLLRRLNEEWGTAIVLVEHRLERCLGAADRVLAFDGGALACDAPPRGFLEWAAERAPALATPGRAALRARRPAPAAERRQGGARDAARARAARRGDGRPAAGARSRQSARGAAASRRAPRRAHPPRRRRPPPALAFRGVWHERAGGRAVLRGVDLALAPGERVALMGRNGAGKSTLLRHANGLLAPTRGRVEAAGRVALLLQNPNDYFLADRVSGELGPAALEAAGLGALADRHPRDLSGGERQRLALAIVSGSRGRGRRRAGADRRPRGAVPRRADARHGPRGEGRPRLDAARRRRRGQRGARGHPRPRVRGHARRARRAARRRQRHRRRPGRRGAERRLVLLDRDGPDRRRRAAARGRRRAAARDA